MSENDSSVAAVPPPQLTEQELRLKNALKDDIGAYSPGREKQLVDSMEETLRRIIQ